MALALALWQPGTRSQQPFETYLYHIPASVVVLKLNYSAEPIASTYLSHVRDSS